MMENLGTFWNAAKTNAQWLGNGFLRLDAAVACATTWDRSRQLGLAIENDFPWGTRLAIWRGASLSEPTARFSHFTPLGRAMDMKRWEIALLLLDAGADPEATTTGNLRDVLPFPLATALEAGQEDLVRALARKGADVNRRNPFSYLESAVHGRKLETIRILLANKADPFSVSAISHSALTMAAHSGDPALVEPFLAAGCSPDHPMDGTQEPMMFFAARRNMDGLAALLLKHGAELFLREKGGNRTSLMMAAACDSAMVCERLAAHGGKAILDLADAGGETALHIAIRQKAKRTPSVLIEAGADVNARDMRGRTPLMIAARQGRAHAVRLLLRHGADPSIPDNWGETPLAACPNDATRHLLQHGAPDTPCDNVRIVRSTVRRLGRLRPPAPSL